MAGGIGSGINMRNAVTIGMLPDIDISLFSYIGNSSLSGAYAMLTSDQSREKVDELARSMTYLELSTEPGYMDAFIAACFLPHTDANLFPSVGAEKRQSREIILYQKPENPSGRFVRTGSVCQKKHGELERAEALSSFQSCSAACTAERLLA